MTQEISRRSGDDGVWRTAAEPESGGNGGSQTLEVVRLPIAFDTAALAVQSFPQVSADAETSSFVIAGDHATLFPAGSGLTSTSTLNSGAYSVASSSFGGGSTTIVVNESVVDEGADGDVINAANGLTGSGIEVYTPSAGEIWLASLSFVSITTEWDGSSPSLHFYGAQSSDFTNGFVDIAAVDMTVVDVDETNDGNGAVMSPSAHLATPAAGSSWRLTDASPIKAVVDDGNGGSPGSMQGEGEIVLMILAAAS